MFDVLSALFRARTVIRTHDPDDGDSYVDLISLPNVSLPMESGLLTINGARWFVVRRAVDIVTTAAGAEITTTLTVVPDDAAH